jgi:hypothetical protein
MSGGYDGRDAARALIAALVAAALTAQIILTVADVEERPWASATFSGGRHVLSVELDGDGAAISKWLAGLPEAQWAMRYHIVADIAVAARSVGGATIEALTVAND